MTIISKLIGIIAFILMLLGLIPFLGWINWITIPIALVGLFIGVFGSNNGGMILNGIILLFAILRLIFGGGII